MQLVSKSFADGLPIPVEFALCSIDAKTNPARKIQSIEWQRHSERNGKTRGLVSLAFALSAVQDFALDEERCASIFSTVVGRVKLANLLFATHDTTGCESQVG